MLQIGSTDNSECSETRRRYLGPHHRLLKVCGVVTGVFLALPSSSLLAPQFLPTRILGVFHRVNNREHRLGFQSDHLRPCLYSCARTMSSSRPIIVHARAVPSHSLRGRSSRRPPFFTLGVSCGLVLCVMLSIDVRTSSTGTNPFVHEKPLGHEGAGEPSSYRPHIYKALRGESS